MSIFSRLTSRIRTRKNYSRPKRQNYRFRPQIESLERRELLHSTAGAVAEMDEHSMVFGGTDSQGVPHPGLVPLSAVTNTALNSGSWLANQADADPTLPVWSNGVPKAGDNIYIPAGITVTLDGFEGGLTPTGQPTGALIRTVRVNGTLNFQADRNTSLFVDTIIVMPKGTFQMGSQQSPIQFNKQARVVFAPYSTINRDVWDPLQFSLGLVTHGTVRINGQRPANDNAGKPIPIAAPSVTSWVLGSNNFMRGTTSLNLGTTPVPKDWNVGDSIIVTGMAAALPYYLGGAASQDEEVKITGIVGNTIQISAPLQYDHTKGSSYVADVTRNVQFVSANPGVVANRGHVMFMHNPDIQVSGAGFYGLGRTDKRRPIDDPVVKADPDNPGQYTTEYVTTDVNPSYGQPANSYPPPPPTAHRVMVPAVDANGNKVLDAQGKIVYVVAKTGLNPRGRYAVHFHRSGDETAVSIDGSAVVDSPGWGIVNHSSNVDVTNNVVFNAVGAGFVTEAGDEVGSFVHNIAIKSLGSGLGVDARKSIQDFGHDGDGFWLQGGNVSLIDNVAASQRHAGFVFFPRGLVQKGFTPAQMQIPGDALPASYGADPTKSYEVLDVPLLEFKNNVAFGMITGYESWFSLLATPFSTVQTHIQGLRVFSTTGPAIFTPYTAQVWFDHVTVSDPVKWDASPAGLAYTGFERNDKTKNILYDHVTARGFQIGISAPVEGTNTILGGLLDNQKNIYVTTTNSDTRILNIKDGGPADLLQFPHLRSPQGYNIYLQTNYQPLFNDITRNFSRDIIKLGLVTHNGKQVYYLEQAANFVPFPTASWLSNPANAVIPHGPVAAAFVPVELQNVNNATMYQNLGLAIGGMVAPPDAAPDPITNALVGSAAYYAPTTYLFSPKWYDDRKGPYYLIYSYWDATKNQGTGAYVYVDEGKLAPNGSHLFPAVPLHGGWNVVTRNLTYSDGSHGVVSLFVNDENMDPSFINANPGMVLNIADVVNGTTFNLTGWIATSYGQIQFTSTVKLNDANYVSAIKTKADGTKFITISFNIQNFAGTTTKISIDFTVTANATLIKDLGQKTLPYTDLSVTLMRLLGFIS